MTPELQTLLTVSIPTLAVLVGILVNNSRLNDMKNDMNVRMAEMRTHFDGRIDDLRDTLRAEIRRVEEVLDARLSQLERRSS